MFDWLKDIDAPHATILGAFLGAIIALLTLAIKDYVFPLLTERRLAQKLRKITFKKYGNPLIVTSISLLFRLKEVLSNRGEFLRSDAVKNTFNDYKRISTLYRLCALLGWLRASQLEQSYLEVKNGKQFQPIQDAMQQIEQNLADGQHTEKSRVEAIATHLQFTIPKDHVNRLGYEIEIIKHKYLASESATLPNILNAENQYQLAKEVSNIICKYMGHVPIEETLLKSKQDVIIRELSSIEGLLYRDWQHAIGDLMIKSTNQESRKYEVIGYKEFEELYYSNEEDVKKWISRANRLFISLDTTVNDRFDNRTEQLKALYSATYKLLDAISKVKSSNISLAQKALTQLPASLN